jgi:hypothetical protein
MLGLRYFIMLCKDTEYKNMDQDGSLGQLYNVQNWIKILYKQPVWAYSFPTTLLRLFYSGYNEALSTSRLLSCQLKSVANFSDDRYQFNAEFPSSRFIFGGDASAAADVMDVMVTNVVKLFLSLSECDVGSKFADVLWKFYQVRLIFAGKSGAFLSGTFFRCSALGWAHSMHTLDKPY